jgi:hypothetical protein
VVCGALDAGGRERVTALDGELRTGPGAAGHGWQVRALLPTPGGRKG